MGEVIVGVALMLAGVVLAVTSLAVSVVVVGDALHDAVADLTSRRRSSANQQDQQQNEVHDRGH